MKIVRNSGPWTSFQEVYCLTLEGDLARQRHASAELCAAGLQGFKFIEGVKADSQEVADTYRSGRVHLFPPCFRCGNLTCGNDDCNNVLIEPQVGCFLSFIKIFRIAADSSSTTFLVFEDDLKFPDYAQDLARSALTSERLRELGFFASEPCLIGLGRGKHPSEMFRFDGTFEFLPGRKGPQNPCFAFNRAFAELALERFRKISHTSDVYIHCELSSYAKHYSLEPPLAYELSTSTGALPSRIHPKATAFENISNDPEERAAAKQAFDNHFKHTKCIPLAVIGSPRGGTGFMAHALRQYGLDIGHELIGTDGISSWLFAVDDINLPFGGCRYSRNSKYVYPRQTIAVIRTSKRAIFSLALENTKNIQSYAFRKKWISRHFDVDVDRFKNDFERALATYIFWYQIVMMKRPVAWVRLEHAANDIQQLFASGLLQKRSEPDHDQLSKITNAKKPYFDQIYDLADNDFDEMFRLSDSFLKDRYWQLRSDLTHAFSRP